MSNRARLGVILTLATLLRFYRISGQSLWSDEGNSVALARRTFHKIAQQTAFDIHPPLYYWLLKLWITIFGDSEFALRSLSAILSVALVGVIYLLGRQLFNRRVGLVAACIATFTPLQIYYAQEARMYMLLALLSGLTVLLGWQVWHQPRVAKFFKPDSSALLFVAVITAGLYTHYAYPLMLLVINMGAVICFFELFRGSRSATAKAVAREGQQLKQSHSSKSTTYVKRAVIVWWQQWSKSRAIRWLWLQAIPILLYLPWLPTAWRQLTTWPSEPSTTAWLTRMESIMTTLLFGLSWPYGVGGMGGFIVGWCVVRGAYCVVRGEVSRSHDAVAWVVLLNWLILPITLTLVIYSPAFLKFLIIASPPLTILLAVAISSGNPDRLRLTQSAALALIITACLLSVYHYHTDPRYARDNYRGIVAFIKAVSGPHDAVILNAEGQQDIFDYYYQPPHEPDFAQPPVYPLPRQRPLDEAETLADLKAITEKAESVYAVYWATEQADPQGLIEQWLDSHLFKATDQWYGNVRLVSYATLYDGATMQPRIVQAPFDKQVSLISYTLYPTAVVPSQILQVRLLWQTAAPLADDYTVFLQLLDGSHQLVGQRDAPPQLPATAWPPHHPITDTHGLFIEPGTPPGKHRLIAGLYNSQTGQRLPLADNSADFIELAEVTIKRPKQPLPPSALSIQNAQRKPLGALTLLGYDFYKIGHRSEPDAPLHAGDPARLVLYWQVERPIERTANQLQLDIVRRDGSATRIQRTSSPAGTDYPVQQWQVGETVRAQFDLFLTDLEPGWYRVKLRLDMNGEVMTTRLQPFELSNK